MFRPGCCGEQNPSVHLYRPALILLPGLFPVQGLCKEASSPFPRAEAAPWDAWLRAPIQEIAQEKDGENPTLGKNFLSPKDAGALSFVGKTP